MSRGIGKTQQRILDELAAVDPPVRDWLFIEGGSITMLELAGRLGISDRQARKAVRSLEERGLVVITRGITWHGIGEYGRMVPRSPWSFSGHDDLPTAMILREGEPWPWSPDRLVASADVELVHQGIPSPKLVVWSVANRISYLTQSIEVSMAFGGRQSSLPPRRAELEELQARR